MKKRNLCQGKLQGLEGSSFLTLHERPAKAMAGLPHHNLPGVTMRQSHSAGNVAVTACITTCQGWLSPFIHQWPLFSSISSTMHCPGQTSSSFFKKGKLFTSGLGTANPSCKEAQASASRKHNLDPHCHAPPAAAGSQMQKNCAHGLKLHYSSAPSSSLLSSKPSSPDDAPRLPAMRNAL